VTSECTEAKFKKDHLGRRTGSCLSNYNRCSSLNMVIREQSTKTKLDN